MSFLTRMLKSLFVYLLASPRPLLAHLVTCDEGEGPSKSQGFLKVPTTTPVAGLTVNINNAVRDDESRTEHCLAVTGEGNTGAALPQPLVLCQPSSDPARSMPPRLSGESRC